MAIRRLKWIQHMAQLIGGRELCVMHTLPFKIEFPVNKRRHFFVITPDDTFMVQAMMLGEAACVKPSPVWLSIGIV